MVGPIGIAAALGRHLVARAGDDLPALVAEALHRGMADAPAGAGQHHPLALSIAGLASIHGPLLTRRHRPPYRNPAIGRTSCRERVCQNVYISVVAGTLKK